MRGSTELAEVLRVRIRPRPIKRNVIKKRRREASTPRRLDHSDHRKTYRSTVVALLDFTVFPSLSVVTFVVLVVRSPSDSIRVDVRVFVLRTSSSSIPSPWHPSNNDDAKRPASAMVVKRFITLVSLHPAKVR